MRGGRGAESEAKPAERHCLLLSVPVHAWCVIPGVNNLQARVPAIVHPGYTSFQMATTPRHGRSQSAGTSRACKHALRVVLTNTPALRSLKNGIKQGRRHSEEIES